jgi:hypothetical protein
MGSNHPLAQLAWLLYRRQFRRRSGVRSERRLTPRSPRLQIHQHLTPTEVAKNDAAFDHRNDANFPTVAKWVIRTGDHEIRPQQHPLRGDRRGGHSAGADRDRDAWKACLDDAQTRYCRYSFLSQFPSLRSLKRKALLRRRRRRPSLRCASSFK